MMLDTNIKLETQKETKNYGPEKQAYCDLCGVTHNGEFYAQGKNYQILSCKRCGLLWANPLSRYSKPTNIEEELDDTDYWGEKAYLSNALSQKKRFQKQLKIFLGIKNLNPLSLKSLKILEVGSGFGFFLDTCEEVGINANGCDISKQALKYANKNRQRVRLGTLNDYYTDETFDAIFAFNLIEHLSHPKEFIIQAKRVLKHKGLLILETPIQESLFHRLARISYLWSKGKLNFFGILPGHNRHIYKFSIKTFNSICKDMGFENKYQRNISSPFGEIWDKSSIASFKHKFIYRLSLPIMWALAKIMGQGNRLFVILQKL